MQFYCYIRRYSWDNGYHHRKDTATKVQILVQAVCISYEDVNTLEKSMHPTILPPTMVNCRVDWLFKLGRATSL